MCGFKQTYFEEHTQAFLPQFSTESSYTHQLHRCLLWSCYDTPVLGVGNLAPVPNSVFLLLCGPGLSSNLQL